MIERVARAMYDWEAEINDLPQRWKNVPPRARKEWHAMARAVLAAMREPTEAMLAVGATKITGCDRWDDHSDGVGEAWRAMIDAALSRSVGKEQGS